ncbi:putative RNA polymerase II Elongator subunit [Tothia fuscella]|uniref:Elongator complex protein 2 n=1 Tax=Tothia fuscella TaxID=1048955 RepID=A0A9P4NPY6_9PEZI|nr:putative RNA polymerase II Elongator subunit [Tothia fuscella]
MDSDEVTVDYISVGGNRHPAAADWDRKTGILAFGADNNIAIWDPLDTNHNGITALLSGHSDLVNVVKFYSPDLESDSFVLSGSVDKTIQVWRMGNTEAIILSDHESSINCIDVLPTSSIFVSGSADATVRVWKTKLIEDQLNVGLVQTISLTPKFFPLTVALSSLDGPSNVLAVAGTKATIQIYVSNNDQFSLIATLTGHEGWIRSLSFTIEVKGSSGDLLLVSASQDRYIRLWRIHQGHELPSSSRATNDPSLGILGKSLSNKAHRFEANDKKYSVTFEALLLGHEDWIYSASWHHTNSKLQLLSASADNSLSIWEADETSGIWICAARLGEISSQKGSTSATGSTGGFWLGLWSPNADAVVSLGRTGSWRLWKRAALGDQWTQDFAVTGHVKEVKGITWSKDGAYLLSTSYDQTTRLHAQWKHSGKQSWHEFSRPQIHGYDLNCVGTISDTQFVSGADEKLLRVFDEPAAVADLLDRLCGIKKASGISFPDAANIPVLGLSNKAIEALDDDEIPVITNGDSRDAPDPASVIHKSTLNFDHPPFEDHLARHMLWPEKEKLYGHGYEISTLATSHDGTLIATACRASSLDHAVIRLYETRDWREIKPSLKSHSLTVTSLDFSDDDRYLLSVGRDRQWTVFKRDDKNRHEYKVAYTNPKGHSRMILEGAWAPTAAGAVFATAGRDKAVKIWALDDGTFECKQTISALLPVTAVACLPVVIDGALAISYGLEDGTVTICIVAIDDYQVRKKIEFDRQILPSKTINQISWRPETFGVDRVEGDRASKAYQLAVASDDTSVRLYCVRDIFFP